MKVDQQILVNQARKSGVTIINAENLYLTGDAPGAESEQVTAFEDETIMLMFEIIWNHLPEPKLLNLDKLAIATAIKRADGIKAQAARDLGIQRTTLIERLKKRGMIEYLGDKK